MVMCRLFSAQPDKSNFARFQKKSIVVSHACGALYFKRFVIILEISSLHHEIRANAKGYTSFYV